ncbi:hypothetical protein Taro_049764 [Colocasia esculenta]|uniref:Phloem protein 2 n=1 Tax=Colocasia esculenta TaxID=4460 RepID=A0A843XBX5_COLES|nr:hypothetical protein [Colocasia esculenta]
MLCARSLKITWSEDPRYWKWFPLQETSNIRIRVAALLDVCWLEIRGGLEISCLTPETTYEAAFIVMIKHKSYGWNAPVSLALEDGEGKVQKQVVSFLDKPRGAWIELKVGEFKTTREAGSNRKEVKVSLLEWDSKAWKKGLVVKSIRVRPKK